MKRLLFIVWGVAVAAASCGPSDGGPWDLQAPVARNEGRVVDAPSDTVLPTEVGGDGFAAGRTTGQSAVSPDGAATYSLPLWLPVGRAGVQPELSLNYKSNAGNGPLGLGWSLSTASRITRCGRTFAQDGTVEPVTFTAADAFCMDGQRLVAVQGTYGASGTEYRTEEESFSKVVSLAADANGPLQFKVYLKSGRILTYGLLHNSTLAGERVSAVPVSEESIQTTTDGLENRLAWALAKMEDRSGNSVTFHYSVHHDSAASGYEQTLDRIEYTASSVGAGMPATRFVDFEYVARPDTFITHVSGFKLGSGRRLKEIRVRAPNPTAVGLVRQYRLTYVPDAQSGLSLLDTFQECDGTGACVRPMSFGWTPGSAEFEEVDTGITDATQGSSTFWVLNPVDVDGDGRDDLLYRKPYDENGRYKWTMRTVSPTGQVSGGDDQLNLGLLCWDVKGGHDGRWADVNADGRMDVSLLEIEGCSLNPASRLKHYLRTNHPPPGYNWYGVNGDEGRSSSSFWYADLQGDGLPDLVWVGNPDDTLSRLGYRPNVGGSLQAFQSIQTSEKNDNAQMMVNLDGTGKSSVLILEKINSPWYPGQYEVVGKRYWAVTWRNGAFEKKETTLVRTDVSEKQYFFADITGDGLPDALRAQKTGGDIEVLVNTGNGFAAPYVVSLPAGAKVGAFTKENGIRVLDFNGDGRQDLLLMDNSDGRSQLVVLQSDGTGFVPRALPIPVGQSTTRGFKLSQVLDFNGDGLMDLAQVVNGSLRLYKRKGQASGMLESVTDSLGSQVRFNYKPMVDPSVYTPGTTCSWPQRCQRVGMWLVSEHLADSIVGSMRVRQYLYEDGRMDGMGRGFLGFSAVTVREVAAGTELRVEFDNQTRVGTQYPYARRPRKEVARVTGGGRLQLQTRTVGYDHRVRAGVGGGSVFTVLPETATEEVYDRLESQLETEGLLRRVDAEWDHDWTYGNPTLRRETLGTEVKTWTAQYQNDALAWLIGLATTESETSTVDGVSVTRSRAHAYQPGTALLSSETVEPGDPVLEQVTTYLRDPDGLAYQLTCGGGGLPARTSNITYDTVDRTWPAVMTNSLGHAVSLAYHGGLGVPALEVDENGLTTRRQYDGFGRLRSVDAPGLGDTVFSYAACPSGASCALTVTSQRRTSAAVDGILDEMSTVDRLGRPLSVRKKGFGGEAVYSSNEYDALGRLAKQWVPSPTGFQQVATTFAYDNLGRQLRVTYPDGTSRTWQYEGNKRTAWDEKNNQVVTWTDAHGRVKTTEDVLDTRRVLSTYTYGPFGVLASVTNGYGQGPHFQYDRLGRPTRLDDPDAGSLVTHYNPFGEVTDETDANGDTTVYARDVLGRITTKTNRMGVSRFTWDMPTPSVGKIGMLLSSSQEGDPATSLDDITVVYTYDALKRPVGETWNVEGSVYGFTRTFDDYGLMRQVTYPGVASQQLALDYQYKPWGTLESVKNATSGHVYWRAEGRNGLGQLTSEVFGNGVVSRRQYDLRGRPLFIDTKSGTQPRQALAYEYEANGNMRARHDRVARTTEDFTYDTLDRLKSWTAFQNCGSTAVDYGYDDLGNLKNRTVRQGVGESLSYFYEGTGGAGPHAVSRSSLGSYTYDGNGNQLTAPGRTVEYTPFNLPSRIIQGSQSLTFRYDAMNRRTVKRSSTGDVTVYLGDLYEVRRAAAGTAVHAFNIVGGDRPVAQVAWATSAAGQITAQKVLYLHADHQGSVETLTDEAGAVFERMRYEPFGGRRHPQSLGSPQTRGNNARVRQGFTGHEHDEEVNLINMNGRMYDPTLARFLSADPLMKGPRTSQTLNRYSYVLNNPLRYTDPSGFEINELPVIVYDSWYGGYAVAGGSVARTSPSDGICYVNANGGRCSETIEVQARWIPSAEFSYFVMRTLYSARDNFNIGVEFGKGLLLGGIAGAVPFLALVPPPEGNTKHFYLGYAAALFAWGGVEVIGGGMGLIGGGGAAVGGTAVAATGVGAPVGAPVAVGGVVVAAGSTVAIIVGTVNIIGAINAVQMANKAGNQGTSASGGKDPNKEPKKEIRDADIQPGKNHTANGRLSMEEAVNHVRNGGDVIAPDKSTARSIAEQAGNGRAVWDPPHGDQQKPHYHPLGPDGERAGGHVLY
ncbi:RHS repeat-associated core domain-containing protein [Pyxidicoccus sp. MSG2]|uniref:RHS repeat-associated core domain-containing protein n=1 Tax=Pyxidicoccus sp. MSG2 TaxID=2996790 RepID=UPI00226F15D6|nr:RHS repeat-associated core domain-containing protein [Pyxidicoccus sp. MSG2]MCY1015539.1 FG-GAP-like repeat-containing protein [Pyxidicoccus sp. MSG2]